MFLYGALVLLLLAAVIVLLRRSRSARISGRGAGDGSTDFFPVHCRHFPQMRQVFSPEDAAFLTAHASPKLLHRWKADRKRAARLYLHALRDDFAALGRLARMLARHSSHLEPGQQARVLWLGLQFQVLYNLALAQILVGGTAGGELRRLTRLVGSLGGQLEKTALTLEASSGMLTP